MQTLESNLLDLLARNEARMETAKHGTWGVCVGCYHFAQLTRHHVKPRSVFVSDRTYRQLIVLICQKCHVMIHQQESNVTLAENHKTVADVVKMVRGAVTKEK